MLTVTSPTENTTVSSSGFDVSGTCASDHQVTVRLTEINTSTYHDWITQSMQGTWTKMIFPWSSGSYRMTVTCDGESGSLAVDLSVASAEIPMDPPAGP